VRGSHVSLCKWHDYAEVDIFLFEFVFTTLLLFIYVCPLVYGGGGI
jgi:hypothetical protein